MIMINKQTINDENKKFPAKTEILNLILEELIKINSRSGKVKPHKKREIIIFGNTI